jgi:hypothetical protein
MGNVIEKTSVPADPRPMWQAPKLQELGNLRTLVRSGHAYGKSGHYGDGSSHCGGEAMSGSGHC